MFKVKIKRSGRKKPWRKIPKGKRWQGYLIVCVGLSVVMMFHAVSEYRRTVKAEASVGWPSVIGKLTEIRVVGKRSHAGTRSGRSRRRGGSRGRNLRLRYTYTVAGQQFESTRFSVTRKIKRERALKYKESHPVGSLVTVYYDPEDPDYAVLETGWGERDPNRGLTEIGVMGGIVILLLILAFWDRRYIRDD